MKIIVYINKDKFNLELWRGKMRLSKSSDKPSRSISLLLLKIINESLSGNGISLDKISGYKIISDVPGNWTSFRVADITLKSLMKAKLAK